MVSEELRNSPVIRKVASCPDEMLLALAPLSRIVVQLCKEAVAEGTQT